MDITLVPILIRVARKQAGLTQREVAERAGTTQAAIARLEAGAAVPTIATLGRLLKAAGFRLEVRLVERSVPDPVIELYKKDVDRTLVRVNLAKSIDQRLRDLEELSRLDAELKRAMEEARTSP